MPLGQDWAAPLSKLHFLSRATLEPATQTLRDLPVYSVEINGPGMVKVSILG